MKPGTIETETEMELERKWKQKDVVPFSVSSVRPNTKKDLLLNEVPWKHLCLSYALLVLIYTNLMELTESLHQVCYCN